MSKRMNDRDNQIVLDNGMPSYHSVYNIYPQKDNSLMGIIRNGRLNIRVTMPDLYASFWSVVI